MDDNKQTTSLKKWFCTVSNFSDDLIRFHWFVKYWRHFLGLKTKGPNLFLCVCVAFAYSIKKAWETRKFHVANVQKNVMQVKKYCFANLNLLLFCRSRCRRRRRFLSPLLLWSRKFVTIVTWGHTFLYSLLTQECKQENWCCRLRCLGVWNMRNELFIPESQSDFFSFLVKSN